MSFAQLCEQRYSVRKFDSRPIEPEKMEMILNAARLAPTAKNFQPQRILVVQGEGLEKMKECTPCMYGQTAVLVVCYDKEVSWKSRSGREIGDVDGGIVMTSMMYQAQDLGIGSLVVGIYKEEPLRASFNIPENYEIVALLMLGYPAEESAPHEVLHFTRKDLSETVSYGTF